jgi:mannose-6-phosphate isomerase-like protein (cupin superfamily)
VHRFDIAGVKERLAAENGGYEVVRESPGLEVGEAVFVDAGAEHRFTSYEQLSVLVLFDRQGRGSSDG